MPVFSPTLYDLLKSKITIHAVPSCSFPPRGGLASKDIAENWAQLITCLCTGSACDSLVMVPGLVPSSFIIWSQKTLFRFIKKKGSQHVCMSLSQQKDDYIQIISPERTPGHKCPTQCIGEKTF